MDKTTTTVNVNGKNVDFEYNTDAKTIAFKIDKSNAFGHPWSGHEIKVSLIDTAGNEYAMETVSNIYVGNWLSRYWIFFTIGGIIVISGGVFIIYKRKKKIGD